MVMNRDSILRHHSPLGVRLGEETLPLSATLDPLPPCHLDFPEVCNSQSTLCSIH